jgi:EmrB/QacA subfamily drug resistance transporter
MAGTVIDRNRKWWILAAMTLALTLISVDQGITPVTLSRIQRELGISGLTLFWVINAYLLAFTVMAAAGGRLGDILGRTKALLFGVTVFTISTICSGAALNAAMLIAARAFQGIGAAFFVTASSAIVFSTFALEERGKAIAYINSGAMVLMILGTLAGGIITDLWSWRWAYFLNVPIAVLIPIILHRHRPRDEIVRGQKIDYAGLILLVISMTSLVTALQQGGAWGWSSPLTIGLLGGGALAFIFFVLFERSVAEPLINFRLLSNRNYNADVVILGLLQFVYIGQGLFGALYLQQVLSFNPAAAGGWSLVTLVLMAVTVQLGGRLFDRTGVRLPAIAGLACLAFGYLWQALMLPAENIYLLLPGLIALGTGMGLLVPAAYTDAMNRVSAASRGQAAGVIENAKQISATLGIAICGEIVRTLQMARLNELLKTSVLSPDKVHLLYGLLSEPPEVQRERADLIFRNWQQVVVYFKMVVTHCYSSTYYLAGILMIICIIIAAISYRQGRQSDEEGAAQAAAGNLQNG